MKAFLLTVMEYLMHASTWKGIVAVLTAAGVGVSPEQGEKIIAAGMAMVGLIQIFIDDQDKDKLSDK